MVSVDMVVCVVVVVDVDVVFVLGGVVEIVAAWWKTTIEFLIKRKIQTTFFLMKNLFATF